MRILIASGASGGHIFPALSLQEALKARDKKTRILLVLPEQSRKSNIAGLGDEIKYISVSGLKPEVSFSALAAIFRLAKGFAQSLEILIRFKPDIVVGFGSLASVPVLILAWFCRIRTLIHEQNLIPGRANRLLAVFADKIALSFPQSEKYLGPLSAKSLVTGNPLRQGLIPVEKNRACAFFGLESDRSVLLVMGGSQGSQAVNRGFIAALSGISHPEKLAVIHLSGGKEDGWLSQQYARMGIKAQVTPFLKSMEYAYSAADLAVCRAGATTLQELIRFRLPAILLPYPFAYAHQAANASMLADEGCAQVLEENSLLSDRLRRLLERLLQRPEDLEKMRSSYAVFKEADSRKLLAEAVYQCLNTII